jgi:hypothetical protein
VPNEIVLEKIGVAQSTWSEEQKRLIDMGLLEKKAFKTLRTNNVCRIVNFRLTCKGRTVAFNLANISRMIVNRHTDSLDSPSPMSHGPLSQKEFEYEVMEAIEVALDSFGINLIPLVKSRFTDGTTWGDVARHPEKLTAVLRDLFGKDGSNTVESMIVDNLKSCFDLETSVRENDLTAVVSDLRQKKVVDTMPREASPTGSFASLKNEG